MKLIIDCSPEQLDVIEDHLMFGNELRVQPDERVWMLIQARKKFPTCKIVSADLDLENGKWHLDLNVT